MAVQFVLWLAVLAVAAGARAAFGRRRSLVVHDETMIDLADEPVVSAGVVGEVLGLPTWGEEWPSDDQDDARRRRRLRRPPVVTTTVMARPTR